jgi:hypothetical protein
LPDVQPPALDDGPLNGDYPGKIQSIPFFPDSPGDYTFLPGSGEVSPVPISSSSYRATARSFGDAWKRELRMKNVRTVMLIVTTAIFGFAVFLMVSLLLKVGLI